MNDTYVTLQGWVGTDVSFRTPKGISIASMRVAVTPRVRREGQWQDGETTWYSVTAWRTLAEHVSKSVRKGDAVIVHGRLRTESWQRAEGEPPSTTLTVEATSVGHDLTRGTTVFLKSQRAERGEADLEREVKELIHGVPDDIVAMDSDGNPIGAGSSVSASGARPSAA
jgi:single-strand DNA-binding protein